MAKNLVIVESPAKGKTIEKYLGSDYRVLASYGHVRDLPTNKIGVDVKKDFEPTYIIPPKAKKVVALLKEEAKKAENIFLATDYDREGEAIGWHLVHALGLKKDEVHRITFHEITKPAILEAIKNPRKLDINLVDAQQARRILDRLVGYKLSPFLWKKIARGLSAGRVQSVTLRLIVEREREIEKFDKQEYWSVEAVVTPDSEKNQFKIILISHSGEKIEKLSIKNEKEAQKFLTELESSDYIVKSIEAQEKKRYPNPPFTTSTLQQTASTRLGFSVKQTMTLAQKLYEDGLITYMRTDSVNISKLALDLAPKVIEKVYGRSYALSVPRLFKTKSKGAQEAHEAIRPTDLNLVPEKSGLGDNHAKLYKLIWSRMIASQMADADVLETNIKIEAKDFGFQANGLKVKFEGFLKAWGDVEKKENYLPTLIVGQKLDLISLEKIQHFTEPTARFNEGSLVKELEKLGIGRPSTYAPTISTIQERGYVQKVDGRFFPQEIGITVNDLLVEHFPKIVDYNFTAKMEDDLDEIAEGHLKWQPVIKEFYEPFEKNLEEKMEKVTKADFMEELDEKCPTCGKNLVMKMGRFGKFVACSGYPDCKYTRPVLDEKTEQNINIQKKSEEKCPKCGKEMVVKEAKFGPFLACSGYPECKHTKTITVKSEVPCPNCGKELVRKMTHKGKAFWGCAGYPDCKTAFWDEPIDKKCPDCGSIMVKDIRGNEKCSSCK